MLCPSRSHHLTVVEGFGSPMILVPTMLKDICPWWVIQGELILDEGPDKVRLKISMMVTTEDL